jgi:hypothetical protein
MGKHVSTGSYPGFEILQYGCITSDAKCVFLFSQYLYYKRYRSRAEDADADYDREPDRWL